MDPVLERTNAYADDQEGDGGVDVGEFGRLEIDHESLRCTCIIGCYRGPR
jgi:hypothetical protein